MGRYMKVNIGEYGEDIHSGWKTGWGIVDSSNVPQEVLPTKESAETMLAYSEDGYSVKRVSFSKDALQYTAE